MTQPYPNLPAMMLMHRADPANPEDVLWGQSVCFEINQTCTMEEAEFSKTAKRGDRYDAVAFLREMMAAMNENMRKTINPYIVVVLELEHYEALVDLSMKEGKADG